jgi:hypothetical protein
MLFCRDEDPHDLHNRFNDPALAAEQRALETALLTWEAQTPSAG